MRVRTSRLHEGSPCIGRRTVYCLDVLITCHLSWLLFRFVRSLSLSHCFLVFLVLCSLLSHHVSPSEVKSLLPPTAFSDHHVSLTFSSRRYRVGRSLHPNTPLMPRHAITHYVLHAGISPVPCSLFVCSSSFRRTLHFPFDIPSHGHSVHTPQRYIHTYRKTHIPHHTHTHTHTCVLSSRLPLSSPFSLFCPVMLFSPFVPRLLSVVTSYLA